MIRFDTFERLGPAVAAFSERSDGDSSLSDELRADAGRSTRRRVAVACNLDAGDLVCVKQVHGTGVVRAGEGDRGRGAMTRDGALGPADALVTDVKGLALAILVADCVPIYLFDSRRRVGGLVHAGWRGTFADVAGAAVAFMQREWASDPRDVWALIGPSAGPCCYEVSEDLAARFRDAGLATEGRHVDLWESNRRRLESAGVPVDHLLGSGLCTICDPRFHSHRRDTDGARAMALLSL